MGEDAWNFVGHHVAPEELDLIKTILGQHAGLSREELAATVCELLGWARASGRLKARECREFLERLEAAGVVTLPLKRIGRPVGARTSVPVTVRSDIRAAVTGTARDVAPLRIVRITTADDRLLFRELVGRHHYLGHAVPFGAHVRYLVYASRPQPQVVACAQFSSAAWRMASRDAWIGWDDATRARQLPRVLNNSRFLILPWVRVKNLASTILAQLARRISADWRAAYGVTPVLLETFIDPARFDGASYRAANWMVVGTTTGRGRNDRAPRHTARVPKRVLIYPLVGDAAQQLPGHGTMGAALAVVDRREDLRPMAHDALDKWLDQIEAETATAPTLRETSERFLATRAELLGACLEAVIRRQYAAELQQTEAVCACGRRLRRRRLDAKEISTLHGRVTLHRPYFYCDACGVGVHPLDAKLGLAPEHHQYDIQERTTRLGAELPYGVSDEQFKRLTGVPASPHFIHETLNAVGEAATLERVLPGADEIARRIETARAGGRRRPVLVVACDGAHAPTRPPGGRTTKRGPGTWREAKGVRLYLLGPEDRVIHVASWHQIADKAELSRALGVVATRIPSDQVRIALVADGAEWIWDVFREHFPEGEEILDYYHCAEQVYETARAQYGEGTLEAQEWAEATLTRLSLNELGAVVGGLLRMTPRTPEAEEPIRALSIYLEGPRERVGYDELRRRGLPRGSGGVESANKLICHVRLKRSGAWWLEANGNAMLRIRCALYNGTFERIFSDYMTTHAAARPSP